MPKYQMRIIAEGATEEEIDRAITAAVRVYEAAGTNPMEARWAKWELEGQHLETQGQGIQLTEREDMLVDVEYEAFAAAEEACCAGWPKERRASFDIEIREIPDDRPATAET
jgi:hypothetical protein